MGAFFKSVYISKIYTLNFHGTSGAQTNNIMIMALVKYSKYLNSIRYIFECIFNGGVYNIPIPAKRIYTTMP